MNYEQIWLVGFMGTGKSRISRPLAAALDWLAVDLDALIEQAAGEGIPTIFRAGGEAAFRLLETNVLDETAKKSNIVVATGGGSVLAEANREAMKRRGFVVCLDARPETIASRLLASGAHVAERPLLQGDDPLSKIIEMKTERQLIYAQIADFIIQTDDLTPDQVTHQVLLAFRERSAVAGGTA